MSFVSITTWRLTGEDQDMEAVRGLMEEKYFPGLLRLGATSSMIADIGDEGFAIVTLYPSREVREDALHHITDLRSEGAVEFGAELTEAIAGEVIARSA